MAGRRDLKPGRGAAVPLAAILVAVLVVHAVLLEWLARHRLDPTALRPLAEPMFTRLLQPQAPPVAPTFVPPAAPVRAQPPPGTMESVAVAPTAPPASTVTAAAEPEIPPTRPAPEPPASAAPREPEPAPDRLAPLPPPSPPAPPAQPVPDAAPAEPLPEPPVAGDPAPSLAGASPTEVTPVPLGSTPASATASSADSALASLDSWPRDTRVNYALSGRYRSGDLYGSARVQWQREANRYQALVELEISLAGSRVLTSQGEVTPEGLRPDVFEEARRGKRRSVRMDAGVITFNDGRTAPRPEGVQDSASQFVELSHRFATGREVLEVGRTVDIWLARPSHVDLWTYDIVDKERLRTPKLGDVEAFRLKPRPIDEAKGNITAEIWFAPTLQYLPVRIRVSMGDEAHVDLMVDTIEQR